MERLFTNITNAGALEVQQVVINGKRWNCLVNRTALHRLLRKN